MRTEMTPPPRRYAARVGRHPLAAGCWFITNKDYPGNGTFCPSGCSTVRTHRALTHAFASCHSDVHKGAKLEPARASLQADRCQDLRDTASRCRETSSEQICRQLVWKRYHRPWGCLD